MMSPRHCCYLLLLLASLLRVTLSLPLADDAGCGADDDSDPECDIAN